MTWKLAMVVIVAAVGAVACSGRSPGPDPVGVTECDEYLSRVQSCASRDPRIKAMEPAFKAQRDAWKQMAGRDGASVKTNCKAALESLGRTMPGCQ
jgi:hypothetical protein